MLDGNPLADIRNTRRVHTVLTRGRVLGPAERARMLAEVEKAARETPGLEAGGGQRTIGCC
ncbi:hypothetical protein JOF53_002127 [Crossiella equi]|uniref:Uncharacterized protein n=1 Tax=Crossiella equi TaxID=130796 RepID=A0ABS5A9K9_9PSEU|nr:hypothetical protein [Crossiella equi]MBP2473255.1 hypothetical protein [Crossiella equi]